MNDACQWIISIYGKECGKKATRIEKFSKRVYCNEHSLKVAEMVGTLELKKIPTK